MGETNFKKALKDQIWLFEQSIILGYRGSLAHGTYVSSNDPDSIDDKDVMGIVIPEQQYYYGISQWGSHGTKEIVRDEWDIVVYELRKMISLLTKGNPNVLSMLWLDPTNYILLKAEGELLIANRKLFATRQAYHSFIGYAHGQLHRMTHYRFEGYMGQKRKQLVDRFGYDTKNASHLIRLLRMGIEFLTEGELYVRREDASQLLEIKRGEWTLEKVKNESDRLFGLAEEAYIHSSLPNNPDIEKINELCINICKKHFEKSIGNIYENSELVECASPTSSTGGA